MKNPEELTRDELYELVKKYVIHELYQHDISLERCSELARSILDHLEIELEKMTPFDALMHLTEEFPELLDATLREREFLWHEQDLEKVKYIKECLKSNNLEAIKKLNN